MEKVKSPSTFDPASVQVLIAEPCCQHRDVCRCQTIAVQVPDKIGVCLNLKARPGRIKIPVDVRAGIGTPILDYFG